MSDLHEAVELPSWPEILRACQDQLAARIHTSLPGIVQSYDSTTQTATVQLAVQLSGVNVPVLPEVPVMWPGGASGFLHVPLAVGDSVLVIFSEEDYGKWWVSGSVSSPAVLARHGLHAIAIPGLCRAPLAATAGHATLAAADLRLGADTATAFVALATLVDAQLSALKAAITSAAATESGASGLGGTSALNTALSGWPSSTAASKVKAV